MLVAILILTVFTQMTSGLNVFISGCSRGIGLGLTKVFLDSGANVIATCRSPQTAIELNQLKEAFGARLHIYPLDVADPSSYTSLKECFTRDGIKYFDLVIANAGISNPAHPHDPALECSVQDMKNVFETNVIGTMLTFQSLHPLVTSSKGKLFVALSSRLASITQTPPLGGYTSYRASKAGVNMYAMTFASDPYIRQQGIKVICMHPGWVQTDMGGSGGRKAPVSVEQSCNGIYNIINKALHIQQQNTVMTENTPNYSTEFEQLFHTQSCVFTGYDGEIIPW